MSLLDNLCRKSLRWFVIFSYNKATLCLALLRLLDPFFFLLNCFCNFANLFSDFFRCLGFLIFSPVERTAKSFIPRSTPTEFSFVEIQVFGNNTPSSTKIEAKNLLVAVLLIVTVLILPVNFL